MKQITVDILQSFPALKNVPGDQLQWFIDQSRHYLIPEGEYLFVEDEPIVGTHILISGRVRFFYTQGSGTREIGVMQPGEITGYLPYSRGLIAGGTGQAQEECQVMTYPIERMRELITTHYELAQALVHVMTNRVREYTALAQQNEKMMALGKLSAGLAHELNNPAAAIVRGSSMLKEHLRLIPDMFKKVISIRMETSEVDVVNARLFTIMAREKPRLSLMERTDLEDEMTDWLTDHNVTNAIELGENLVEYGFTPLDLEDFKAHIPEAHLSPVFNWINTNLVTEKMVNDIQEASQRISDLVSSVKNFTHMDRGQDKQYADIHTGISNTLTMMAHKLRKANIEVLEKFDTTLPHVKALVGELNQVWTNVIDNAIDAMEPQGKGVLEICTERDGEFVKVSIVDNGPGIPEDIQSQIFDPFFTTKEIGKGTGLGLDVVHRIVVNQHRGSIKVASVPGRTIFTICFPING